MAISTIDLTTLAFCLNGALDGNECEGFTVDAAKKRIADGTILPYLEGQLGRPITFFLSILDEDQRAELMADWTDMVETFNERKSALVQNSGICLLLAYALEGIQRRVGDTTFADLIEGGERG